MTTDITCTGLSPGQILENAHEITAVPSIWILTLVGSLIFLIFGMLMIDWGKGEHPFRKFGYIWFFATVALIILATFLSFSPNFVNAIYEFFINLS